jgi:predicted XRE-type DNA-binding protein
MMGQFTLWDHVVRAFCIYQCCMAIRNKMVITVIQWIHEHGFQKKSKTQFWHITMGLGFKVLGFKVYQITDHKTFSSLSSILSGKPSIL